MLLTFSRLRCERSESRSQTRTIHHAAIGLTSGVALLRAAKSNRPRGLGRTCAHSAWPARGSYPEHISTVGIRVLPAHRLLSPSVQPPHVTGADTSSRIK